jgi:hypothetical protein
MGLKRFLGDYLDAHSDKLGKGVLKLEESHKSHRIFQFYEDIQVALFLLLAARIRAENSVVVTDDLYRTFTTLDRFAGVGKVMRWLISRLFTGGYGSINGVFKSPLLGIPQKWLKLSGAPIFRAMFISFPQVFKRLAPH